MPSGNTAQAQAVVTHGSATAANPLFLLVAAGPKINQPSCLLERVLFSVGLNEITFPVPTEILRAGVVSCSTEGFSLRGDAFQDERDFIRSKGPYLCDVHGGTGSPKSR